MANDQLIFHVVNMLFFSKILRFHHPSNSPGLFLNTKQLIRTLVTTIKQLSINDLTAKENNEKRDDGKVPDVNNPQDWVTVYRFDQIKTAQILCRAKVWQTFITGGFFSSSAYAYLVGSSNLEPLINTSGVCCFACVMLYIFGNIFNKIIGFAYVSHDKKWLKLSHLTFWGKRCNIKIPIDDLEPLPTDSSSAKMYQVMYRRTDPKFRLILPLICCTISDTEVLELAFKIPIDHVK